jgi:hypothetical protein
LPFAVVRQLSRTIDRLRSTLEIPTEADVAVPVIDPEPRWTEAPVNSMTCQSAVFDVVVLCTISRFVEDVRRARK